MGLEVNLIKTLTKTVNECKTVARKGYRELFQLSKESPLRKRGFTEIKPLPGGNNWELRGKFSSILFSEVDNSATQTLHTGTRLNISENGTTVIFGSGNNATKNGVLRGFSRDKVNLTFFVEGHENITVPRNSSKSKIQEILYKLLGKQLPKQKWTIQEFDRRIAEDFSEEMIKPVHDYLEGKLAKKDLIKLIRQYKKYTPLDFIPSKEERIIGNLHTTVPTAKKVYPVTGTEPQSNSLNVLYRFANVDEEDKKILDEFFTTMGMQHHQSSPLYRFIGKSEYEKLIAGNVVNSRAGYNGGVRFDVTPKPDGYFGDYRVKLNVEASPETMLDYWSKRPLVSCQKSEQNYYHWNVREYDIKDVRSIVDWRNKKVVYESDDEILSRFIDEYISKLG